MKPHAIRTRRVLRGGPRITTAVACAAALLGGPAGAFQPPAARPAPPRSRHAPIVDPAVVPAGGIHCRHCEPGGHLADCRDGLCAPHCPVRPSQYGFYRTQWRRWPGQGVVPASAAEAATPVAPPATQVPTVEEESPPAPGAEPMVPEDAGAGLPTEPIPEPPDPADAPDTSAKAPVEDPAPISPDPDAAEPHRPVPPTPPGDPPIPPAPDDDADAKLFERSEVPAAEPVEAAGAMRYPAAVGRSVTAGLAPWRLLPPDRQRAAESARGL